MAAEEMTYSGYALNAGGVTMTFNHDGGVGLIDFLSLVPGEIRTNTIHAFEWSYIVPGGLGFASPKGPLVLCGADGHVWYQDYTPYGPDSPNLKVICPVDAGPGVLGEIKFYVGNITVFDATGTTPVEWIEQSYGASLIVKARHVSLLPDIELPDLWMPLFPF